MRVVPPYDSLVRKAVVNGAVGLLPGFVSKGQRGRLGNRVNGRKEVFNLHISQIVALAAVLIKISD